MVEDDNGDPRFGGAVEGDSSAIYQPARGGSAVVVSPDGSFLFATSQVAPEEHQAAFSEGRRTDPALFE
jgi:hypothetical protein